MILKVLFICFINLQIGPIEGNAQNDKLKRPTILYPCKGNKDIRYILPEEQPENDTEKNFFLIVDKKLPKKSVISITITLPSEHNLEKPTSYYTFISEEKIEGKIYKEQPHFKKLMRTVKGKAPYITSVNINGVENCKNPGYIIRDNDASQKGLQTLDNLKPNQIDNADCGRRKLSGAGLIHYGLETKPGDWPWHAALFVYEQYISKYVCGGTLISKNIVLTAAHCVTVKGVPIVTSALTVGLGKYNIFSGNTGDQEKEVHKIKVHEDYDESTIANDIALIQLKSEAVFSNYVQPACLWSDEDVEPEKLYGTVVGWGKNENNTLSRTLTQLKIPKISDVDCLKSNPSFFGTALNEGNFCGGYRNGSSVCNGDSGGGFMVFFRDIGDQSENPQGSWHVRGIVSLGVLKEKVICNANEYTLYTDVSKYLPWITENMQNLVNY